MQQCPGQVTDPDALSTDHDEEAALAHRRLDRRGHTRQLLRELFGVQPNQDDGRRGGQALLEDERAEVGVERQEYARLANREGEDGRVVCGAEAAGTDATSWPLAASAAPSSTGTFSSRRKRSSTTQAAGS